MKQLRPLILILVLLAAVPASAQSNNFARVSLRVEAPASDENLKNTVSSSIERHLRALGNVIITEAAPEFEIVITVISGKTESGGDLGWYALSLRISQMANPSTVSTQGGGYGRVVEEWLRSGPTGDIEDTCKEIVTVFNAKALEPHRRSRAAARSIRAEPIVDVVPTERKLNIEYPKLEAPRAGLKNLDGDSDPGIDVATVIAANANLRAEPSAASRVISQLQAPERLALVERIPTGPWFNVIHVDSGEEGWIHGSTIKITHTAKKFTGPVFEARRVADTGNPSVVVKNDSDRRLTLKVGTTVYKLLANSEQRFTIEPGEFRFYASVPGVLPAFGKEIFQVGYAYSWRFWIVTSWR